METLKMKVIKQKNGVPTVIEFEGRRYVLDNAQNKKAGGKKNGSKTILQNAAEAR
jgi:hypothetical protein